MRSSLRSIALILVVGITAAAHADTYDLTFTPSSGPDTVFTLTTPSPYYLVGVDEVFLNTPATSGGSSSTFGRIDLLNTTTYGGSDLALCSDGDGGGCPVAFSFFSGTQLYIDQNTLNVGTFNLSSGATVTIADEIPLAATPEPSSLMLLGTGILGLAGAARRRLLTA